MFSMRPLNFGYPMDPSYPGQTTVNFSALSAALGVPVTFTYRPISLQMRSVFPDVSEQLLQLYNKTITEQRQAEQETRVQLNQNPLISRLMYPAFPGLAEQLLQLYNRTVTGERLAEQETRVELSQNRVGVEGNISSAQVVREEPVSVQSDWLDIKVKWRRILYGLKGCQTLKKIRQCYFPNDKDLDDTQISKAFAEQLSILRSYENNSSETEKLAREMNLNMEEIQELKDLLKNSVPRKRKRKSVSRVSQETITSKKTKTGSNKSRSRIYGPKWGNLKVRWKFLLEGLRLNLVPSAIAHKFFSDDKNVNVNIVANALRNKLQGIKKIPPTNKEKLTRFGLKMGFQLKELQELTKFLQAKYKDEGTTNWKNLKIRWKLIFNGLKDNLSPKEIATNLFPDHQGLTAKMVSDTFARKLKALRDISQKEFKSHATRMGLTVEELQDLKQDLERRYPTQQSTLPSDVDSSLNVRLPLSEPLASSLSSLIDLTQVPLSPKESEQLK